MYTKMKIKKDCDVMGLSESVRWKAETLARRLICFSCIFAKKKLSFLCLLEKCCLTFLLQVLAGFGSFWLLKRKNSLKMAIRAQK